MLCYWHNKLLHLNFLVFLLLNFHSWACTFWFLVYSCFSYHLYFIEHFGFYLPPTLFHIFQLFHIIISLLLYPYMFLWIHFSSLIIFYILILPFHLFSFVALASIHYYWGITIAQWLRRCATNWKVACSIPDGVIGIFHWHNPTDCTMALGSTQPLTEMSTRSISWG